MPATRKAISIPAQEAVLTKAVAKAAELLDLTNADLSRVLGLSQSTVSRLRAGTFVIKSDTKEFELAAHFVRLFRGLDAITGSDDAASQSWLRADNRALDGKPIERISTIAGLFDVVAYMDASRASI
jgi:hypothetical protein